MEPTSTAVLLTVVSHLLGAAALLSPLSRRLGIPALLVVLGLGMLAGSEGLGGLPFNDYHLAFRLGTIALVLILFDGGLGTPLSVFRRVVLRAGMLATFGVVLTAALVTGTGVLIGLSWHVSVLLGAVVSSTDAAAVFSVLRGSGVRLREPTGATLEVESGLNDPMAFILTVAATEAMLGVPVDVRQLVVHALVHLAIGAALGVAIGLGGRWLLRAAPLPAAGLYPVLVVAFAFAAFGVPTLLGGSGFLAVYVAAMVLADGPLPYRVGVRRVFDALAWLSQLLMFLLLGLLVFPSRLWPVAGTGIAIGVALACVARPVAVLAGLVPFAGSWRERAFVAWGGLRGAVPIILATYPVLRGVPEGETLFHLVFFVVLVNGVVPGATLGWLARRWALAEPVTASPPASVELVSLREYRGEFVWYTVYAASAAAGALVRELPIPDDCVLTLLLRGDDVVAPRGDVRLEAGDQLCAFVTPEARGLLDLVFGRERDETA